MHIHSRNIMNNLFLLLLTSAVTIPAFPQSMKMVVDTKGNIVGRYVRTNADSYTVGVQDIYNVSKSGNKIVTFRAENGQGVIWCKQIGKVNVYSSPSTEGEIIGHLVYEDGYVPDTYQCLGKKKGWYMVKIDRKTGYVHGDAVQWDGMDTF